MQSRHHPSGNAINHFDNAGLEKLIATHQNGDPSALGAIVEQVQERARTLIRFHHTTKYQPEDALLSDINFRLVRNVGKFDSARGSAFTFVSALIWNCLRTNVTAARKFASRHVELDEAATEKLTTGPGMLEREAIEDFTSKLRHGVKSVLTDEGELATQRWYIDSFCDEDFASPRHRCANSCMRAYGVGHAR